jgi:catechol 2,3-dioxygenase-like lactoylglutathione lyase family enzyme
MRIVTGVDFVGIATSDLPRAMDFYENVLGLEPSKKWQRGEEDPIGAEFETGTLTLALMDSVKFGMEVRPNNHPIALHVDDYEAAKAELESRGVEFKTDTIDSGVCWQSYFEDPDGNSIGIHHRYAS